MNDGDMKKLADTNYDFPSKNDPDFQEKIYKKREFYYHKMQERQQLENYDSIQDFRNKICSGSSGLLEQQSFLSNYINPDTPNKGVLVFHGVGSGKCLTSDQMVKINNTYIY